MTYAVQFEALATPTRRAIFEHLLAGPASVADIAAEFPVSRPAVSQHLAVLKSANLVKDIRSGTRRIYAPNPEGMTALRNYCDQMWDDALTSYQKFTETQGHEL